MNEHDLHAAFGDLARRGTEEQTERMRHGDGLSAERVTLRAGRARRRRAGAATVSGLVVAAALVLGGTTLADRPQPQPATPPTPTVTTPAPSPDPTPDPLPSSTPSSPPLATQPARDDVSGFLQPYPVQPRAGWTIPVDRLWTPSAGFRGGTPILGDVTASPHSYPGFRALAAEDRWVLAVGDPYDEWLVGVDAAGGAATWQLPDDEVLACAGVHDGLLVCLGPTGDGSSAVQLRDPATGSVVRTAGPGGTGIAVADGAVVVHRADGADVHVEVRDLTTGERRADVTLAGAYDPDTPQGDGVLVTERAGSVVLVRSVGYQFALDARTGTVLGQSLERLTDVRPDGWVTGYAEDGTVHAVGPDGQDVPLPGTGTWTARVWAPASDVSVPLLSGSDAYDGEADVLTAVDPASGEVLWTVAGADAVVAVVDRVAVAAAGRELVGVDLVTGEERWRTAFGDPAGFDGERLVLRVQDRVHALAADDGAEAWSLPLGPEVEVHQVAGRLVTTHPDGSFGVLEP